MAGEAGLVRIYVQGRINRLSRSPNESMIRSTLARLRRGIGKAPGSMPELWEETLGGLPEGLSATGDAPTRGEWAVHTALTLFALHQQGTAIGKRCMSREGASLGQSLRDLVAHDEEAEARIQRRLNAAATSDNLEGLSHHLRGLIQLLKDADIPLDYPMLAEQLYWFQVPAARDNVRLRWGRDFYRIGRIENRKKTEDDRGGSS